jgi:hypothetical protein
MSYVTLAFSQGTSGVLGRSTVVGGLLLDAATSENLTLETQITDHPVEDGSDMTDHIKNKPEQLQISGLIGDASLAVLPSAADLMSGAVSGIASYIGGGSWKDNTLTNPFGSSMAASDIAGARSALQGAKRLPSAGRSRLVQAVATLIAAREAKLPVAVVTGMRYYPNYYITQISFSRNNSTTGGMLEVSVSLRTIRIVSTEQGTLQYPNAPDESPKSTKESKASKTKANKGKANQKPASAEMSQKVEAAIFTGD